MAWPLRGSSALHPPSRSALRCRESAATMASADSSLRSVARPLPFQARGEVSPGKEYDPSPHSRRIYLAWGLAIAASRVPARSPPPARPRIRFLFVGPRLRSPLPPHGRSPSRSCGSLRLRWPAHVRTLTSWVVSMLGARGLGGASHPPEQERQTKPSARCSPVPTLPDYEAVDARQSPGCPITKPSLLASPRTARLRRASRVPRSTGGRPSEPSYPIDCSAVIAATSAKSWTEQPRETSLTGWLSPWKIGPIARAPPSRSVIL